MDERKFRFFQRWLTIANLLAVGVGLAVAFAGNSFVFELHNQYSREVFFDGAELSPDLLTYKNWLFGVIGGTIVGFHLLVVAISEFAFKNKEAWAYWAIWVGMLSWFLIDSGLSLYFGAIHNVLLINLVAMVLISVPLVATRKAFAS